MSDEGPDESGIHASDDHHGLDVVKDEAIGCELPAHPIPHLSQGWMDWLTKEGYLESGWRTRLHMHLDFSDRQLFGLESFHPDDFDWGGKPTKDNPPRSEGQTPVLPVFKLVSCNLNDNKLKDDVFDFKQQKIKSLTGALFANLRILKMSGNQLQFPQILLPQLRELHMSRNQLTFIPILGGMPKLEVLNVSHNHIKAIRKEQFADDKDKDKHAFQPKLQVLDISSNQIEMEPYSTKKSSTEIDLFHIFESFNHLALQTLVMKDNPFCNYFSEYQLLAVYHLEKLERLDDLDLEAMPELRSEMRKQAVQYFGVERLPAAALKEHFKSLNQICQQRKTPTHIFVGEEKKRGAREVKLQDLVKLLDDAIAEPESASTYITLVFEDVCHYMKGGADAVRKNIASDRKGATQEALDTFVQTALILVERYEEHRMMLLKSIAKFAMVAEKPLMALASLATGEGAPIDQIMKVLEDNALSELARPLSADSFRIVILGLAQFDPDSEELAEAIERFGLVQVLCLKLQPIMHTFLGESDPQGPFQGALLSVLRCAVKRRENAMAAMNLCDEFANRLSDQKEFLEQDGYNTGLYLNVAEILCSCIQEDTRRALADADSALPQKLVRLAAERISKLGKADSTDREPLVYCKKIAAIIQVITAIMQDPEHLEELLRVGLEEKSKDNGLINLIMRAPSEASADPVILGACLVCCTRILNEAPAALHQPYLKLMALKMDLQKDNKILPYLDTKKFKDLYRRCAAHNAQSNGEARNAMTAAVPEFVGVTNKLVHKAVASIVGFLGVFSVLEDSPAMDDQTKELCALCSKVMNDMGRDRFLLKLLEMPSDDVRKAVVECLKTLDPSQFEQEEIDQLFDMLNPEDVKKEESLMSEILSLFLTLLQGEGEDADEFCKKYAKQVLQKTVEILSKNAERNTHGVDEDEEQKAALSMRAVELFFVASKKKHVRPHMRSAELSLTFRDIIINEEVYNSLKVPDINLEISWTGRAIENLLTCLSGNERLATNKRQGFRLVSRVADIMEGGSDTFRRFDVTAEERAQGDSRMWSDQRIKTQITYVDDMEYDDRTNQQQCFVSFHCVNRLLSFIEYHPDSPTAAPPLGDDGIELNTEEKHDAADSAVEAKLLFADVQQHAEDEDAREQARIQKEFDRDEEDEVDMDSEDPEPPEDHENLLRTHFMEQGWKVSTNAQKAVGFSIPPQPRQVKLDEKFYKPGTDGEVSMVFPLAALLRALYALLLIPAVERLRLEITQRLREVATQQRFIALLEAHGRLVDCHVAAKYLRVISVALRMAPDQTAMHMTKDEDHEYILGLAMSAGFAARCLKLITPLLANMGRGYTLTPQQQNLAMESMRMLSVVSAAAPYVKLSHAKDIQASSTEYLLTHFIPMSTVQSVVLCLLYDMQVNVGSSHGTFINAKYVRSSMQRQGLRELCTDVLANVIHSCPAMRYDIYESFYKHEVLGKVALRVSFLNEMIQRVEHQKYIFAMETMIQEKNFEPGERILKCVECEMPLKTGVGGFLSKFKGGFKIAQADQPRMLVITSKRLLLMERPRHGRYMGQACGHCPPESFCPVGPSIEIEHTYSDMTRVIRGVDSQMFVIGWIEKNKFTDAIEGEQLDVVICHRSDVRRQVIETLCSLSGPDVEKRVEPQRDMLIKQTSEKRLETPPVCMSFAFRQETGDMFLCVLSETNVSEVEVRFECWLPPFEVGGAPDVSDDEAEAKIDEDGGADPALLADENVKVDKMRLVNRPFQTRAQEWFTGQETSTLGLPYNSIWRVDKRSEDPKAEKEKYRPEVDEFIRKMKEGKVFEGHHPEEVLRYFDVEDQRRVLAGGDIKKSQDPITEMRRRINAERQKETKTHVDKVIADRQAAVARFKAKTTEAEKLNDPGTADGQSTSGKHILQNVMRKARASIFSNWTNWKIQDLELIEFDAGEVPILRLGFKTNKDGQPETVGVRFLDDVARERWRRGLAYILNKSDTAAQWQRKWEEQVLS